MTDAPSNPSDGALEGYPGVGRVLVVIPTYNEAENVRIITGRVREAVPQVEARPKEMASAKALPELFPQAAGRTAVAG